MDLSLSPETQRIMDRWEAEQQAAEEAFYEARARARAEQKARLNPPPPLKPRPPRCTITRNRDVETIATGRVGDRMVHGIALTPSINTKGRTFLPIGCHVRLPVPLLSEHRGRVGECVLIRRSEQQIYVRAVIDSSRAADHVWQLVQEGALSLSAGACPLAEIEADNIKFIDRWILREVSLVRRPANLDCRCEVFRP
jgi:hypothetical protein